MDTELIAAARKLAAEARERQQFPWVDPFAIRLADEINRLADALERAQARLLKLNTFGVMLPLSRDGKPCKAYDVHDNDGNVIGQIWTAEEE